MLLLIGCAEVLPPPGGPEDRSGPNIIGSEPAHGEVGVTSLDRVTIYFSEKVDKPSTGSGIIVSPRQEEEPDVNWQSDRVEIILADSLLPDRTYMFAIGSGVRDYRNNPLDSNAVVAFSTGETIDSGLIAGRVLRGDQPAPGISVALYDIQSGADVLDYDSLFPAYLTETTRDGGFRLQFLSEGRYRLLGFNDRNRDSRFNSAREPYALPDRPIVVGGVLPLDDLTLLLTATDTTTPAIAGADFTPNNLLRLRLATPIDPSYLLDNPGGLQLVTKTADSAAIPAVAVREARDEQAGELNAVFDDPGDGGYLVRLTYDTTAPTLLYDSIVVSRRNDNTAPLLLSNQPEDGTWFVEDVAIRLQFSEPIDTTGLTDETFALFDNDSIPQPLGWQSLDPFWLQLTPDQLVGGRNYRVMISEFDIADQSGNLMGDSLREFSFRTINPDSLGAISGDITILLPDRTEQPIIVTATQLPNGQTFEQTTTGSRFMLDVPGGQYLVSGFIDANGDGELSAGSIDPLILAEPVATIADTIRVRPRFETSGNPLIFR